MSYEGKSFVKMNVIEVKSSMNIVFAKGSAHLLIVHALHLPEPEIIFWGGGFWGEQDILGAGIFSFLFPLPHFFFARIF